MQLNMNIRILTILCLTAGLLSVSCGSQKKLVKEGDSSAVVQDAAPFSQTEYFNKVYGDKTKEDILTAKISCEIKMDDRSISTTGSLRMKRDDVIQISLLVPKLGMIELGRIEFTKERMLVVDRINKKYIDVPYNEVDFLKRCDVDFNTLQNLFWNQIFVPSQPTCQEKDFTYTSDGGKAPRGDGNVFLKYVDDFLTYQFRTEQPNGRLSQTQISSNKEPESKFAFDYSDFNSYKGVMFPHNMVMSFIMGHKNASLTFGLSSLKDKSGWETRTKVSDKYTKQDPEKIFRSLLGS